MNKSNVICSYYCTDSCLLTNDCKSMLKQILCFCGYYSSEIQKIISCNKRMIKRRYETFNIKIIVAEDIFLPYMTFMIFNLIWISLDDLCSQITN